MPGLILLQRFCVNILAFSRHSSIVKVDNGSDDRYRKVMIERTMHKAEKGVPIDGVIIAQTSRHALYFSKQWRSALGSDSDAKKKNLIR